MVPAKLLYKTAHLGEFHAVSPLPSAVHLQLEWTCLEDPKWVTLTNIGLSAYAFSVCDANIKVYVKGNVKSGELVIQLRIEDSLWEFYWQDFNTKCTFFAGSVVHVNLYEFIVFPFISVSLGNELQRLVDSQHFRSLPFRAFKIIHRDTVYWASYLTVLWVAWEG